MKIKSTRTGQVFDAAPVVLENADREDEIWFVYFEDGMWRKSPAVRHNCVRDGKTTVVKFENLFVPAEPGKDY